MTFAGEAPCACTTAWISCARSRGEVAISGSEDGDVGVDGPLLRGDVEEGVRTRSPLVGVFAAFGAEYGRQK